MTKLLELLNSLASRVQIDMIANPVGDVAVLGFVSPEEAVGFHVLPDAITVHQTTKGADIAVYGKFDDLHTLLTATEPVTQLPDSVRLVPDSIWHYEALERWLAAFEVDISPIIEPLQQRTYFEMPLYYPVAENRYRYQTYSEAPVDKIEDVRLPKLIADEHPTWVAMAEKAWQIAYKNQRQPEPESNFVSNFIDTAFNDNTFIWDSCFIMMFARYAPTNMMGTLDNFYGKQHVDGYICREINTYNGADLWIPHEGRSTGPNIIAWTEWLNYQLTQDVDRVQRIFPALIGYHLWWKEWRTHRDGSYWTTGLGSGMDNQTRVPDSGHHHRQYVWADAMMQQALSCRALMSMGEVIGRTEFNDDLQAEYNFIAQYTNEHLWDEETKFYYDLSPKGEFSSVKSVGAYWALLAGIVPPDRAETMIQHLNDPKMFNRPHRIPTQSADAPDYFDDGHYWLGGVWAPTNYMVLRALTTQNQNELAHEIALNHVKNVAQVFEDTGTLWENYAPEYAGRGEPSRPDFVGWTGLSAIAIPIEYLIGLRPDPIADELIWDIRLDERHGVVDYPLATGQFASLICEFDDASPHLKVECDSEIKLRISYENQVHYFELEQGQHDLILS